LGTEGGEHRGWVGALGQADPAGACRTGNHAERWVGGNDACKLARRLR
jgi:hypothetical protein